MFRKTVVTQLEALSEKTGVLSALLEAIRTHEAGHAVKATANEFWPLPDDQRVRELPADVQRLFTIGTWVTTFFDDQVRDNYSAEPGLAIRDDDEENPGKYKITFRTRAGEETLYRGVVPPSVTSVVERTEPLDDPWQLLQDTRVRASTRGEALIALLASPSAGRAFEFTASELARCADNPEWQATLVFVAEEFHIPAALQRTISEQLLCIADRLRLEGAGQEKVVWAALRRGASLLSPAQVEQLQPFLSSAGAIDARAVALQAIARLFEPNPPSSPPLRDLGDRAFAIGCKFLDADVFSAGDSSLIARNSLSALAAIGDDRLPEVVELVQRLKKPWMTRRVREAFLRLKEGWTGHGVNKEHPAVTNLMAALSVLG